MSIEEIKKSATEAVNKTLDLEELENLRVKYLGRKGELTMILRGLKDLSDEEKRKIGPQAQQLKSELEGLLEMRNRELIDNYESPKSIDVTRPGKKIAVGHLGPLSKIEEEVRQIFLSMNFSVVEGPEIENEYYNFDALNIPAQHPARDAWDTFWLKDDNLLLRTHTSPMQVRYMEKHNPPFQIIVPGRVFRYEASDFSHDINFHQIEGLMVGEDVSLANFKFVVEEFFRKFFGKKIEFRYRPSYFPFTEPSVEVDIKLKGKWLEMMGAGMVNRKVFEAIRYNPDKIQGFAFGMGWDRLAMVKYNIPDIRLFFSGDLRFINQF